MRTVQPRITIGRCMVLTAVVAVVLGAAMTAGRINRRKAQYQRLAAEHAEREQNARGVLALLADYRTSFEGIADVPEPPPSDPETTKRVKELLGSNPELNKIKRGVEEMTREVAKVEQAARSQRDYHAQLKKKYEQAAARPWLPVSADPQDPDYRLMEMMQAVLQKNEAMLVGLEEIPLPPGLEIIGTASETAPAAEPARGVAR